MSAPILPLLSVWPLALLLLAGGAGVLPARTASLGIAGLNGLGLLLCLVPRLFGLPPSALTVPAGPPGLSLHLALDPLSAWFLVLILAAGTGLAVFQAYAEPTAGSGAVCRSAACAAGTVLALLAADAATLTVGVAMACGAIWLEPGRRRTGAMLIPLMLLAVIALLTPAGYAPRFDAIRTAPPALMHASAASVLTIAAIAGLVDLPPAERCWTRDALIAGLAMPMSIYLLMRLTLELPAAGAQMFWGILMMLVGGALAVRHTWRAAASRQVDGVAGGLVRGQAGLAMAGTGLTIVSRVADLPAASGDALAGTLLLAAGGLAGTGAVLAAHAMAVSAGTYRLSRLGGLWHLMPVSAVALGCGLLALAALPPGLGFAGVWLLLRSIVSAPRTGGLAEQVPLAITAATVAFAAVLATTSAVRLTGIAVLGRPRTPRGAGAREIAWTAGSAPLALAGISIVLGLLPGLILEALADPILRNLTGVQAAARAGPFGDGPGYLALPVAALVGFFTAAVLLLRRWQPRESRATGPWCDGAGTPEGLPFGDPLAQAAGQGFLPKLPALPRWRIPRAPLPPAWRLPPQTGFWLLLIAAAAGLIVLALTGSTG